MKTSNKIIIAFVVFIVSGMLVLFVDSKQHEKKKKTEVYFKEYALPAFSVVIAEENADVHLDKSDSTVIKVEYLKGKAIPNKIYEVKDDTLYVYGGLRTFVKCPNFKSIIGNKPLWVGLKNIKPDTLIVNMHGGKLNYKTTNFTKNVANQKFSNLKIFASDSARLEIKDVNLNNLKVLLTNATVFVNCVTKNAAMNLEKNARIECFNKFENLTVKKDTSSVFVVEANRYKR